jgi:hypothetical protein
LDKWSSNVPEVRRLLSIRDDLPSLPDQRQSPQYTQSPEIPKEPQRYSQNFVDHDHAPPTLDDDIPSAKFLPKECEDHKASVLHNGGPIESYSTTACAHTSYHEVFWNASGHLWAIKSVKYLGFGSLLVVFLLTAARNFCTPKIRADRQARREERHRPRLYPRAAKKCALRRQLLARTSGKRVGETYEEKEALLLGAEDGMSSTMSDELSQLWNAAEIFTPTTSTSSFQE